MSETELDQGPDADVVRVIERFEAHKDEGCDAELLPVAMIVEALHRVADELAALRESLDLREVLTTLDADQVASKYRMVTKILQNLAEADKKRAKDQKVKELDERLGRHAEAAE